jgi:hypothetical protein
VRVTRCAYMRHGRGRSRRRVQMRFSAVIRSFDLRHLGTCRRCMRISFVTMTVSWVLLCGALWLCPDAVILASVGPVGLTAVWVAHVVARSTRSVRSELPKNYSRRLAIRTAVMAAAGAAVVSVISSRAFADGMSACGGWGGGPESGCSPCPSNCYRQNDECGCAPCASCCQGGQEC